MRSAIFICSVILVLALTAACQQPSEPSNRENTPTLASYFGDDVTLKLISPSEVRQWEQVTGLDVVMTNEGQDPITFSYGASIEGFTITNAQGKAVWYIGCCRLWPVNGTLDSGDSISFSRYSLRHSEGWNWDQRDLNGFPVEPGEYHIKGFVSIYLENSGQDTVQEKLETAMHTLVVKKAPLPEYAQSIDLELTLPPEVQIGDGVPIEMRVTNASDDPVEVRPRVIGSIGTLNSVEIIIFSDGKPMWKATKSHGIHIVPIVLEQGGSPYGGSASFLWEWNQFADCGNNFRRIEACDEPVEPVIYEVRGYVNLRSPETGDRTTIATVPRELVIFP